MADSPLQQMTLVGLVSEHMGLAAWNADGTGPEPERELRSFDTPLGTITHHTYVASPDYGDIDPLSPGALKVVEIVSGFQTLAATLNEVGGDVSQITVSFGLSVESPGEFHHDANHLETRTLITDGPNVLRFAGRPALEISAHRMLNRIDWNVTDFYDSVHYSEIGAAPVLSVEAEGPAEAVGRAILEDVAGGELVIAVDGVDIRDAATFGGHGRQSGMLVDLPSAQMSVMG